jgi:Fic family protein
MTTHTFVRPRTDTTLTVWRQRIGGEYREMPDLELTAPQAARLWGLDSATVERILNQLCDSRLLSRAPNGTYRRS